MRYRRYTSISKGKRIWSIVSVVSILAMILTVLISLHKDGKFSAGSEEALRVENTIADEAKFLPDNVELLAEEEKAESDISENDIPGIILPEDKLEQPLKIYVKDPSIEEDPGVEAPIVTVFCYDWS